MLKLKLQYFGHLVAESQLTGKDPNAGKDLRPEEKGAAEDKLARWHHQLNGHEFEQAPGGDKGQGSLVYCSSWSRRVGRDLGTEQQGKPDIKLRNLVKIQGSGFTEVIPFTRISELTGLIPLQSKGLSRAFSITTVQKNQFFNSQPSLWSSSHVQT